ncbi:MAG: bifunctional [glutamine synthetase] adenylyltransferase/[glutamine synthetase]-adenylyl-L-tyrosine phosphorylase [Pseudomonadota bacterium]
MFESVAPAISPYAYAEGHKAALDDMVSELKAKAAANPEFDPGLLSDDHDGFRILFFAMHHSPFLSRLIARNPVLALRSISEPFEDVIGDILSVTDGWWDAVFEAADPLKEASRSLRQGKEQIALAVGLADLAGSIPLERVIAVLSDFADSCVNLALSVTLERAYARGELLPPDQETPVERVQQCGLICLAMGKWGARELNYSSDIDLILLFDPDRFVAKGRHTPPEYAARVLRTTLELLQKRTHEGYVFRTDLRLRPDPSAMAAVPSVLAAENYYQSLGKAWERAAMIKARPAAGDLEAGRTFLKHIRPFVWRRSLDYSALEDIQSIKLQIHEHHGHREFEVAGYDVKLGRGGIREIEFFAQIQQLIHGGREPLLRTSSTQDALAALATTGYVSINDAQFLVQAYRFFRKVEHRLQMIDDQQTHSLPEQEDDLQRAASFCNFRNIRDLEMVLRETHLGVRSRYDQLLPETTNGYSEEARRFRDRPTTRQILNRWRSGEYRALRSDRARAVLERLMPELLNALCEADQPETALSRFDQFLKKIPYGVQILFLFQSQPWLFKIITLVMTLAPALGDYLGRRPEILEELLAPGFFDPPQEHTELGTELERRLGVTDGLEDKLDTVRGWYHGHRFRFGVLFLEGRIDGIEYSRWLSRTMDRALSIIAAEVEAEFRLHHGDIAQGTYALVALGSYGIRQISPTSDLDLLFIYHAPTDDDGNPPISTGEKRLGTATYYARLAKRIISAITAQSREGKLSEVDMRLRPSGNQGMIATSLEGFIAYHQDRAWVWEKMALTRARVIVSTPAFREFVTTAITTACARLPKDAELKGEVREMRHRLANEFPEAGIWDLKHRRGGLEDLSFVLQYLQLKFGMPLGIDSLEAIHYIEELGIIELTDAKRLRRVFSMLFHITNLLRLSLGASHQTAPLPTALSAVIADIMHVPAAPAEQRNVLLQEKLEEACTTIENTFIAQLGPIRPNDIKRSKANDEVRETSP